MSARPILKMGDPRLLRIAPPVKEFGTAELKKLVDDMLASMAAAGGVGLAAPQIGEDIQVVIFSCPRSERYPVGPPVPMTVLCNPTIEYTTEAMEDGWEGCLSIPGMRGLVPRHTHIRYRGFDIDGNPIEREAEAFHARVVQHECDHLIGKLYPTRMTDLTKFGFTEVMFPHLDPKADD